MLVSAEQLLKDAAAGHYAVGQFNLNNLEWAKAVLETAEEMKAPVILGVTDAAAVYMGGYRAVAALVRAMEAEMKVSVPVVLHYDHGTYEGCKACMEAGFTSVMFDGSKYSIEENLEKTAEIIALCHKKGISMEAEVGSVAGEEDGISGRGECADPEQCGKIADLGVTMLAAGIGNVHGVYPANWKGLDFSVLSAVKERTGSLPLVLHGGSGVPEEMMKKAISLGIAKINVNTECQIAFAQALHTYFAEGRDLEEKGYNLQKIMNCGTNGVKQEVRKKMQLFGCAGRA